MKKIVIIGDSLPLPRKLGNEISILEHTWPVLLENQLRSQGCDNIIYNRSLRRRTTTSLTKHEFNESIVFAEPDTVIFQIGIVDCMPRVISLTEYNILNNRFFPEKLRSIIINQRKNKRIKIENKDSLKKVYVKPRLFYEKFNNFIKRLLNFNSNLNIIIIPILINNEFFKIKSPAAEANVNLYNNQLNIIIKDFNLRHFKYDNINNIENFFSMDGYHLGINGHKYISNQLANLIVSK